MGDRVTIDALSKPRFIPRKLSWSDAKGERYVVEQDWLLDRVEPLVILGEPGMGKSELLEKIGSNDAILKITARAFLREPNPASLLGSRKTLVIDALDEVAAAQESDPVQDVLKHLALAGRPRFILSCRVSDWNGAPARTDIEETYSIKPLQLSLEPFSEADALVFLADGLGEPRAKQVLAHYSEKGLSDLFGNPQTLSLISDASKGEGALPDTRADLLDKACRQMALEHNERRGQRVDSEALLDAAGAMSAMLILSAKDAVSTRAGVNVVETDLPIAELAKLPGAACAIDALNCRLFVGAAGDRRFTYVHRTVAEYLAARWLGQRVERAERPKLLAGRLIELIRFSGGVPASLRGVHAWLPKFSTTVSFEVIAADPIGVLKYGDGDGLSINQGRAMLEALDKLAAKDPNFRAGDWSWIRAKGLVQSALEIDVRARIASTEVPFEVRSLLLECVAGSELVIKLQDDLLAIVLDPSRSYGERRRAADSLEDLPREGFDWLSLINKLVKLKDTHSTRLAVEAMVTLRDVPFDADSYTAAVLANTGILLDAQERKKFQFVQSRYNGDLNRLRHRVPDELVMPVLDKLAAVLLPQRADNDWHSPAYLDARSEIAGFSIHIIRRQLDIGGVSPRQLFEWLNSMERGHNGDDEDRKAITEKLESDAVLRQATQHFVLLQAKPAHAFWDWSHRLSRLSWGLRFTEDDLLSLLEDVVRRNDVNDRERWKSLVLALRENGVVPNSIRKLARPYAKNDPELLEVLAAKRERQKLDDWEKSHRRRERKEKQRREANLEKHRQDHEAHIAEIERGNFAWIINPAKSYLGQFSDIDSTLLPSDRIASWLGEAVAAAAEIGFEAVLHRHDRPTFTLVVERYTKGERWNDVYPILAGAARRFVSGIGFSKLDDDVMASIGVIEDHEMHSVDKAFEGFGERIASELRSRDRFYQTYVRNRFEPQLIKRKAHIDGFAQFTRSPSDQPLSAKLCLEWLAQFTDLPIDLERQMAECVIFSPHFKDGRMMQALRQIVEKRLVRGYQEPQQPVITKIKGRKPPVTVTLIDPNPEAQRREWERYWTALLFLVDFDAAASELPHMGADNRDWLWFLTNFYFDRYGRQNNMQIADITRLVWIVETFRPLWKYVEHPQSSEGTRNEWDATERIESAIFRLAANPSPEAAEALQRLLAMPADGYTEGIKTAMARQHQVRVEASFRPLSEPEIVAALTDGPPLAVGDIMAIVCDELDTLQMQIDRSSTNMIELFYENGEPKGENDCRDTMLNLLKPRLPHGIVWTPELHMQGQDRADCGFTCGALRLPLEAKGQWHRELWIAAETQLFNRYAQDWQAGQRGLYLVFWFGARGKAIKNPPRKISKTPPVTPSELRELLNVSLPPHIRPLVTIKVLNLEKLQFS